MSLDWGEASSFFKALFGGVKERGGHKPK